MSTVKTDAITAVSTNGDLSLDGLGTGGVSIASTLKMTKGGDITSASPLVIDTDGNFIDGIVLLNGYNIITIKAEDKFGREVVRVLELVFKTNENLDIENSVKTCLQLRLELLKQAELHPI